MVLVSQRNRAWAWSPLGRKPAPSGCAGPPEPAGGRCVPPRHAHGGRPAAGAEGRCMKAWSCCSCRRLHWGRRQRPCGGQRRPLGVMVTLRPAQRDPTAVADRDRVRLGQCHRLVGGPLFQPPGAGAQPARWAAAWTRTSGGGRAQARPGAGSISSRRRLGRWGSRYWRWSPAPRRMCGAYW